MCLLGDSFDPHNLRGHFLEEIPSMTTTYQTKNETVSIHITTSCAQVSKKKSVNMDDY